MPAAPRPTPYDSASGQRRHRAIHVPFGMVIPRRHLRDVITQTPVRRQGRMAADCGLIDTEQLAVLRPRREQHVPLCQKGRLFLRGGLQVTVAHPTLAQPQGMQDLAHPLPAVLHAITGGEKVLPQRGAPQTHIVAPLPWTPADDLLALRPLLSRQSGWAPWERGVFQPWQTCRVEGRHPSANRLCIPIQPAGNLGATPPVHQEHNAVGPVPQSDLMGVPKGGPHRVARDGSVRDGQHLQTLPRGVLDSVIPPGSENRDSFVGLL
jgi:hypothetical protein